MLNRNELFLQIKENAEKLFPEFGNDSKLAQEKLAEISMDPVFKIRAELSKSGFLVPCWDGKINDVFEIKNDLENYVVLAVDGSQVYPDRNISGAGCFLVNTGGCFINYSNTSEVKFFSEPRLFLTKEFLDKNYKINFSHEIVDLKREELEFKKLFEFAVQCKADLSFVDGTIIFWSLEGKQEELRDLFLNIYLDNLNKFYEQKKLIAGYISFPKSREFINLIKLGFCRFEHAECIACHREYENFPCSVVDNLIDTQILRFLLKENQRTTVFWSTSKITKYYPEHLKPCFFYLNIGKEIIRIETFSWVAKDSKNLDFICKVVIDQAKKGLGYPVVLAEAHEQAVVKAADRDFFYSLIQREALEQDKRLFYSQKSIKKRGIGI